MPTLNFYKIKYYDTKMGWREDITTDPWQAQEMKAYRESQGYKVILQQCRKETIHNA